MSTMKLQPLVALSQNIDRLRSPDGGVRVEGSE